MKKKYYVDVGHLVTDAIVAAAAAFAAVAGVGGAGFTEIAVQGGAFPKGCIGIIHSFTSC